MIVTGNMMGVVEITIAVEVEVEGEGDSTIVEEVMTIGALMIGAGASVKTTGDGMRNTDDRIVGTTTETSLALQVIGNHQLLSIVLPTSGKSRSRSPTKIPLPLRA